MKENITGKRLRDLREKKNVSQAEVANFLGIERTTYTAYESGKSRPVRCLDKLAQYYNVSIDYILGLSDSPLPKEIRFDSLAEKEKTLLLNYWELDETGRKKVDEYIIDLIDSKKYTEKENAISAS
jgi:transcriptional regulator with XRE-family HTH domain